jgi:hypothetical protein
MFDSCGIQWYILELQDCFEGHLHTDRNGRFSSVHSLCQDSDKADDKSFAKVGKVSGP